MLRKKLSAIAIITGLTVLSSCAPPKTTETQSKFAADGGQNIIQVQEKKREPHKTVEIDGVEFLQARGTVGKFGGTFLDTQIGDGPKTFNGWASYDATSSTMADMLFAGLVITDAYTGEVIPYLAKSVELQDDQITYIVTLRKGLQWSDGTPLTSEDVVFTWNEIIKAGLGNPSMRDIVSINGQFPEVRALDELTIEFKTAVPFAPFKRNLAEVIAPAHILRPVIEKGGDKAFSAFWGTSDAARHPEKFISSGMWLLEKYETGQRVIFKRNPNFFMVDKEGQRLPYLDRYVISFVGDINNQQLRFEQGDSDTYGVTGNYVAHVRMLKKPEFTMYNLGPAAGSMFMSFNLNTRKDPGTGKPYVDPVKSSWFTNQYFRKAVDWAINREDIVTNILKGVGAPLFTPESLASIFLNEKLAEGHPRNLDQAKEYLKKGGFSWNDEGQLIDSEGHRVEFNLYTNSGNTERESVGVNIKEDLAELGMKVNFKPMDFNVLVGKLNHQGDWEAVVMGLTGGTLEPHNGFNVWKSDGALHMFNQRDVKSGKPVDLSDRFPWEKELDEVFVKGVQSFEFNERKKIYDRYQEIAYEQLPFIYLYSPLRIIAVRDRVKNFDPTPLEAFHNLEEIWIEE